MTVKTTEPKIDTRPDQNYAGIRAELDQSEMGSDVIPKLIGEVFGWLNKNDIAPDGIPFMRFHIINMPGPMHLEIGVPVAASFKGDGRVNSSVLPAGRYASLVYTDVTKGVDGNGVLINWGEQQGLKWDAWDDPKGHAFRSRYEVFIDGPQEDPDPTKWRTEVAIKLAD